MTGKGSCPESAFFVKFKIKSEELETRSSHFQDLPQSRGSVCDEARVAGGLERQGAGP